ncbi:MAG: hypothetical protein GY874_06090 [Desulfobacteraceae bacterium]|nr:hypothetical protein [Desulfobacteraceae bacterium]
MTGAGNLKDAIKKHPGWKDKIKNASSLKINFKNMDKAQNEVIFSNDLKLDLSMGQKDNEALAPGEIKLKRDGQVFMLSNVTIKALPVNNQPAMINITSEAGNSAKNDKLRRKERHD